MMSIMLALNPVGTHLAGWRHPSAWSDTATNLEHMIALAQIAERGKFDAVFQADGNGVLDLERPDLLSACTPTARNGSLEPLTMLSAIAMRTKHVGLVATATTTYDEPFFIARRFASLDHISGGRAGWNVVTGSHEGDALNFSAKAHVPKAVRYERAREAVEVVFGLWDSWAEDAFPEDKAAGVYINPDRLHVLNHEGKHFQVMGPLNVARTPQGRPLIFQAGQSEAGRNLSAAVADCMFCGYNDRADGIAFAADMRKRVEAHGRDPKNLKLITATMVYVAPEEEQADALRAELDGLIPEALGVEYLSRAVGEDLSQYDVDDPMPVLEGDLVGMGSYRVAINEVAQRRKLTIRQTYQRFAGSAGAPTIKGSPKQIADHMQDAYESGISDGFMIIPPVAPAGLEAFVELVIPELQRRGLFRIEYEEGTLRERLGLPVPTNPNFPLAA